MNSDFIPYSAEITERRVRPAPRTQFTITSASSVSDSEFKVVLEEDEFHKVFVELSAAFYEDYGRELDPESVVGLRRFLKRSKMRARPAVGAESNGRLIATWRDGAEALSLEFVSRYQLKFAVTANHDGRLRRHWGIGHSVTLFYVEPLTARFALA